MFYELFPSPPSPLSLVDYGGQWHIVNCQSTVVGVECYGGSASNNKLLESYTKLNQAKKKKSLRNYLLQQNKPKQNKLKRSKVYSKWKGYPLLKVS